jgi:prenyltransferase beta subunit
MSLSSILQSNSTIHPRIYSKTVSFFKFLTVKKKFYTEEKKFFFTRKKKYFLFMIFLSSLFRLQSTIFNQLSSINYLQSTSSINIFNQLSSINFLQSTFYNQLNIMRGILFLNCKFQRIFLLKTYFNNLFLFLFRTTSVSYKEVEFSKTVAQST